MTREEKDTKETTSMKPINWENARSNEHKHVVHLGKLPDHDNDKDSMDAELQFVFHILPPHQITNEKKGVKWSTRLDVIRYLMHTSQHRETRTIAHRYGIAPNTEVAKYQAETNAKYLLITLRQIAETALNKEN